MTDVVSRLRQQSWCGPLHTEAADEIERLRAELRTSKQTTWMIVSSNGGYMLERSDMERYPGDGVAMMEWTTDPVTGSVIFRAYEQKGPGP